VSAFFVPVCCSIYSLLYSLTIDHRCADIANEIHTTSIRPSSFALPYVPFLRLIEFRALRSLAARFFAIVRSCISESQRESGANATTARFSYGASRDGGARRRRAPNRKREEARPKEHSAESRGCASCTSDDVIKLIYTATRV